MPCHSSRCRTDPRRDRRAARRLVDGLDRAFDEIEIRRQAVAAPRGNLVHGGLAATHARACSMLARMICASSIRPARSSAPRFSRPRKEASARHASPGQFTRRHREAIRSGGVARVEVRRAAGESIRPTEQEATNRRDENRWGTGTFWSGRKTQRCHQAARRRRRTRSSLSSSSVVRAASTLASRPSRTTLRRRRGRERIGAFVKILRNLSQRYCRTRC